MKGRTWCINFLDSARSSGDVTVKWKVISGGQERELRGRWEGYTKGMTARQKAGRFYDRLRNDPQLSRMVAVTRSGNLVCFQLRDGAPFDDIGGIDIGDETGQTFHVFDDSDTPVLETGRFRLAGRPESPDGKVRLGVGHLGPRAEVSTFGKSRPRSTRSLLSDLMEAFNALYGDMGFEAQVNDDEVVIPKIPCEEGLVGGTNDVGLDYWLSLADPGFEPFTTDFDKVDVLGDMVNEIWAKLREHVTQTRDPEFVQEDDDGAAHRCHTIVREVRHRNGTVDRTLICRGKCPDGTRCRPQSSTNQHGGTREWCGCPGEREPDHCHPVIITPGPGEGGGPQRVVCAGGGCEPLACVYKAELQGTIGDKDGAEVWYIKCSCR